MPFAIRIHKTGGPEVMQWEEIPMPKPGPGEILLRQAAVGVNYIDVYHRTGFYPAELPFTPGLEGVGVVETVGEGVMAIKPGTRVAYCKGPLGAYAQYRTITEDKVLALPDNIDDKTAAAIMLKGLTAHYLLRRTYPVGKGTVILVHAAAGGVGLLLCQWGKALGATVLGTVSTPEKAAKAKANGCDYPILYTKENVAEKVSAYTKGEKCHVVYDSVGKTTFEASLDSLRPLGTFVSYGQSSGALAPVDTSVLAKKGSLFMTRPTLFDYVKQREDYEAAAKELFDRVLDKTLAIHIGQEFPLSKASDAHKALESRVTEGSTVLVI
ncbi:MAG: quinone oxidoreductase [Rickettsiales bacterium]